MNPWWSQQTAVWFGVIGGAGGGMLCGLLGTLIGILVPRGAGRRVLVPLTVTVAGAGVLMLGAGLVAAVIGQPWHVYYPLLLTGVVVTTVMGGMVWLVIYGYRRVEQRRMQAEDLRRG